MVGNPRRRRHSKRRRKNIAPPAINVSKQLPDTTEKNTSELLEIHRPNQGQKFSSWPKGFVVGVGLLASAATLYQLRPNLTPSIHSASTRSFPVRLSVFNGGYLSVTNLQSACYLHKVVSSGGNVIIWSEAHPKYEDMVPRLPPGETTSILFGQSVRLFVGNNKLVAVIGDIASMKSAFFVHTHANGKMAVLFGEDGRFNLVGTIEEKIVFADVTILFSYSPWLSPWTVSDGSRAFLNTDGSAFQWTLGTKYEPDRIPAQTGDTIEISDLPLPPGPGRTGRFTTP